jgi:hypothetical protein
MRLGNRDRTLAGAATSAERIGDTGKAKEYYSLLIGRSSPQPESVSGAPRLRADHL